MLGMCYRGVAGVMDGPWRCLTTVVYCILEANAIVRGRYTDADVLNEL